MPGNSDKESPSLGDEHAHLSPGCPSMSSKTGHRMQGVRFHAANPSNRHGLTIYED